MADLATHSPQSRSRKTLGITALVPCMSHYRAGRSDASRSGVVTDKTGGADIAKESLEDLDEQPHEKRFGVAIEVENDDRGRRQFVKNRQSDDRLAIRSGAADLSPCELALKFTDTESYFVSEASTYRLLKAHDLLNH